MADPIPPELREGSDGPMVMLDPKRLCCPGHGEMLRARWPDGYLIVGVTLSKKATENPDLWAACGHVEGGAPADVEQINEITATRPLCYWVTREQIRDAFMDSGILSIAKCAVCKRTGPGGPYQVSTPRGVQQLGHMCLECACDTGDRIHRAYPDGRVW